MENQVIKSNIVPLLILLPVLGIFAVLALHGMDALTNTGISAIITIVVLITSTLVAIDNIKYEHDQSAAFTDFVVFIFMWIGIYPFYLLRKANQGHKDLSLLGGASMFLLIIGSLELVRLRLTNVTDTDFANDINMFMALVCGLIVLVMPVWIAISTKSANTILVLIGSLISCILIPYITYTFITQLHQIIIFAFGLAGTIIYLLSIKKSLEDNNIYT